MTNIIVFAGGFCVGVAALRCAQVYGSAYLGRRAAAKADERRERIRERMQSRIRRPTHGGSDADE